MIKTKKFIIEDCGDPTTGISPSTYTVNGYFSFTDNEELEWFRNELKKLFTDYTGGFTPQVLTEEEFEEENRNEREFEKMIGKIMEDPTVQKRKIGY